VFVMIDNYDSFTYNVVRYFQELGARLQVVRNDQVSLADIAAMQPTGLILSPGPGTPDQSGISLSAVQRFAGQVPILGVCLGHQTIGQAFGGKVVSAKQIMHGKTSTLVHNGKGLFAGLPRNFLVTRYHSLVLAADSIPKDFVIDAWTTATDVSDRTPADIDEVMAIRHQQLPLWGVQFHPEAVLTEHGQEIFKRFMNAAYDHWQGGA